jgi:ATP-dependent DNA helicase PIF1
LKINNSIVNNIPREKVIYKSRDTINGDEEEVANFPTEFLNTLKISGIPPHLLQLKVGAIIIILENIDLRRRLCN